MTLSGRSQTPFLIVVGGPPGTGKTTIARRLAGDLSLPLMSKDTIKEVLFDELGTGDRDWSQRLGRASIRLLYKYAETQVAARRTCIIESNFWKEPATVALKTIQERHAFHLIQILCWSNPVILLERLIIRARSRERHPGHLDDQIVQTLDPTTVSWRSEALEIPGHLIELDTTNIATLDYPALFCRVGTLLNQPA